MATNMRIHRRTRIYAKVAVSDPDTMYFNQAMKENDATQFLNATHKELAYLLSKGIFELIPCRRVQEGYALSSEVQSKKQKRRVLTREIYRYKARLNLYGSNILPGVHYNNTYTPVVAWESIRILLYTVLRNNWNTMQIDYVLHFPQQPAKRECYTNIPKGIEVKSYIQWLIESKNNIYGQYQAGRVWNTFLVEKLTSSELGFRQSNIDVCMFYRRKCIYILYTDYYILA